MCNIAGYAGNKQAAPILLEMLRRQAHFDGGFSTGIATIHEGKIYARKILGNIDEFIEKTDVLSLPGNIGIIHSRPANNLYEYAHPFLSPDGKIALVLNGTGVIDDHTPVRNATIDSLASDGYYFRSARFAEKDGYPQMSTGEFVATGEGYAYFLDRETKKGKSFEDALIDAASAFYGEHVTVCLNLDNPDSLNVCRITRPMYALFEDGETYIATTRFAFPDDAKGESMSLPVGKVCTLNSKGLTVHPKTAEGPVPCDLTPEMYDMAYTKFEKMLTGKKDSPLVYDDLEVELWFKSPEIWYEQKPYQRFAELTYDVLYDMYKEGKLKMEVRPQPKAWGTRDCAFMWI